MKALSNIAWLVVLLFACALALSGCTRNEPVKVGFVGGMSGRVADLGVAGRNGVMLAIEQANARGGIKGRPLELLVQDDDQNPERAKVAIESLLAKKPEVVIGPMTSSMAMVMVPRVNRARTLLLSPTVTTNELSGIDDYFMRVISGTRDYASKNARYQFEKQGLRRVAAIYDLGNRAYTESWLSDFQASFEALGGELVGTVVFRSGSDTVFATIVPELFAWQPDGILVLGNAVDAALICQQAKALRPQLKIAMSEWAATERFIELAGQTAEGVVVAQFLDRNDTSSTYRTFRDAYLERFGQEPGFAGLAGYDAALVVLEGLANRTSGEALKETLLRRKAFQGVQQTIHLDRFGDADRRVFITAVHDGRFQTME